MNFVRSCQAWHTTREWKVHERTYWTWTERTERRTSKGITLNELIELNWTELNELNELNERRSTSHLPERTERTLVELKLGGERERTERASSWVELNCTVSVRSWTFHSLLPCIPKLCVRVTTNKLDVTWNFWSDDTRSRIRYCKVSCNTSNLT